MNTASNINLSGFIVLALIGVFVGGAPMADKIRAKRCSCAHKREIEIGRVKRGRCNCPWDDDNSNNNNNNDNSAGAGLGLNLNGLTSLLELRTLLGLGGLGAVAAAPPLAAAAPPVALQGIPIVDPVTGRVAILGTGREAALGGALGKREENPRQLKELLMQKQLTNGASLNRISEANNSTDSEERYTAGTDYGQINREAQGIPETSPLKALDHPCQTSEECEKGSECRWSPSLGNTRSCQCIPPRQRLDNKCIVPHNNNFFTN